MSPVHAILLDHELPDHFGIEICRDIRRVPAYATIPIIMLTATDSEENTLMVLAAGAAPHRTHGRSEHESGQYSAAASGSDF